MPASTYDTFATDGEYTVAIGAPPSGQGGGMFLGVVPLGLATSEEQWMFRRVTATDGEYTQAILDDE